MTKKKKENKKKKKVKENLMKKKMKENPKEDFGVKIQRDGQILEKKILPSEQILMKLQPENKSFDKKKKKKNLKMKKFYDSHTDIGRIKTSIEAPPEDAALD